MIGNFSAWFPVGYSGTCEPSEKSVRRSHTLLITCAYMYKAWCTWDVSEYFENFAATSHSLKNYTWTVYDVSEECQTCQSTGDQLRCIYDVWEVYQMSINVLTIHTANQDLFKKNWKYLRTSHALLTTSRNCLRWLRTPQEDWEVWEVYKMFPYTSCTSMLPTKTFLRRIGSIWELPMHFSPPAGTVCDDWELFRKIETFSGSF